MIALFIYGLFCIAVGQYTVWKGEKPQQVPLAWFLSVMGVILAIISGVQL